MFQLDIETYENPFGKIETCYTSDFEKKHQYMLPKDILDALNKDFAYYRHPFTELRYVYVPLRKLIADAMMNGSAEISCTITSGKPNYASKIFERLNLLKEFSIVSLPIMKKKQVPMPRIGNYIMLLMC